MLKKSLGIFIGMAVIALLMGLPIVGQKTQPENDDFHVIGDMSGTEIIQKLAEIGDDDDARALQFIAIKRINPRAKLSDVGTMTISDNQVNTAIALNPDQKPYLFATRAFGYLSTSAASSSTNVDLVEAGNMAADPSLKGQAIKIKLDRLRIFDYPGKGVHNVLFDFSGRHQTEAASEALHFNQTYRAPEGQGASINGVPIFVGLRVGDDGVFFNCKTVNVSNEDDDKLLGFLDTDTFKQGLQLINNVNPLVPIVSGFAEG